MKFNLSDFLQLDTKGLLAVNGGYNCNGSTNNTVYPNTYYPSGGNPTPNDGGGNDYNGNKWYSKGDIVDSIPRGGTFIKSDGKSFTYSFGRGKSKNTTTFQKNSDGTYLVTYNHYDGPVSSNGSKNSSSSSGGGSCSTPSSSPDSSSGKSNNPNGQGPSTTSSNPSHGGGTCPGKDGGTHIPPSDDGNGTGDGGTDIPNGGGICGGTGGSGEGEKPDTEGEEITNPDDTIDKTSGSFGQITDGSYADKLTMQKYSKEPYKYHPHLDEKMNGSGNTFSHQGCKMTAAAKIASEVSGQDIDLYCDINQKWDNDKKDGLMSDKEIAAGLKSLLGDDYNVNTKKIDAEDLSINKLKTIADSENTTYVLAKVNLGDVNNDGEVDFHWVVIEGYSQDSTGKITFTYDGTSDNDAGRTYVLGGNPNPGTKTGVVVGFETYTITKK